MSDLTVISVSKTLVRGSPQTADFVGLQNPNVEIPNSSDSGRLRTSMAKGTNELLTVETIGLANSMRAGELRTF